MNFNESSYTQAILPVSKGSIGIASASHIALPAFLASATGAKCALSCTLPEEQIDASVGASQLRDQKLKLKRD